MNPCSRICSPEPRLSAIRPNFSYFIQKYPYFVVLSLRADDRVRTGDLNLGKVPRYQLRYVRIFTCGGAIYPKVAALNQSEFGRPTVVLDSLASCPLKSK